MRQATVQIERKSRMEKQKRKDIHIEKERKEKRKERHGKRRDKRGRICKKDTDDSGDEWSGGV